MDADPWAEYARLQAILDRSTDVNKAAGIEEAMANLLTKIERGEPVCSKKVKNLVFNRINKERRRCSIVRNRCEEIVPLRVTENPAESRLVIEKCRKLCGEREFDLLMRNALGFTYNEIAVHLRINANTVKIRAFRARRKLTSLAA